MSALLELSGLEVAYGPSQVLFGLDLALAEGEAATLLGRNGMGKTTTLRAICGLEAVKGGTIRFAGERIDGWRPDRVGRAGIALVPEGRQCFPNLTVDEHLLAFFANRRRQPDPWTPARVFDLFPRLAERKKNLGNQLSGGEQQMLAIGRALLTNPDLLILDEATEGLAPFIVGEIWRIVAAVRASGIATLVVDRNYRSVLAHTDRAVVLEKGRVAWTGPSAVALADQALLVRYLGV